MDKPANGADDGFDYIIVGAGASGCALAYRLSEDPRIRVLLLEAGGPDDSMLISMPKGIAKISHNPKFAWRLPVEQPRVPGAVATEIWSRGRVLGGSTSINGMVFSRGHPDDYARWQDVAGPAWGWGPMRAAFRAMQDNRLGGSEDRGVGGPVKVGPSEHRYPVADAMIAAGEQMGLPRRDDLNSEALEGVGYYTFSIRDGRRQSASRAFLDPIRHRRNLSIVTGAHVDRVVLDGRIATGVAARIGDRPIFYAARGEVILTAGNLLTPKILQVSGIGPGAVLQGAGIDTLVDNPHVGQHMREHMFFRIIHRLTNDRGMNWRYRGLGLALSVAQYYATRRGPMSVGVSEVGAFVRTRPHLPRPDVQLSMSANSPENLHGNMTRRPGPEAHPGMMMQGMMLDLTSEGSILVASPDPAALPRILPNWLSTPEDEETVVAVVRYMRRYFRQPALARYLGEETSPGSAIESDEDILATARRIAGAGYHGVGTCRMGREGEAALDPELRVRGVDRLRVADCSAMPTLISGNTAGPAMAFGWRAADVILGRA